MSSQPGCRTGHSRDSTERGASRRNTSVKASLTSSRRFLATWRSCVPASRVERTEGDGAEGRHSRGRIPIQRRKSGKQEQLGKGTVMPGPWDNYQARGSDTEALPWEKYSQPSGPGRGGRKPTQQQLDTQKENQHTRDLRYGIPTLATGIGELTSPGYRQKGIRRYPHRSR